MSSFSTRETVRTVIARLLLAAVLVVTGLVSVTTYHLGQGIWVAVVACAAYVWFRRSIKAVPGFFLWGLSVLGNRGVESDARRSVYTLTDRVVLGQVQQGHRQQEGAILGQWRRKYPLRRRAGGWT